MIIAFDPSTKNVGFVICEDNLFSFGSFEPRVQEIGKKGQFLKKNNFNAKVFYSKIKNIFEKMEFSKENKNVVLLPDMFGQLNGTTIKKLNRLCGIIEAIALEYDFDVIYLNESSVRTILKKEKGTNIKEKSLNYFKKNVGVNINDNDDIADAFLILYYFLKN